jgi:hypothetical protein
MRKVSIFIAAMVAMFMLTLTACGTNTKATPDSSASAATSAESAKPASDVSKKNTVKAFGAVSTYSDGVSISVGAPVEFIPTRNAAGVTPGQKAYQFQLVITNNTQEPIEPFTYSEVSSGGVMASHIFDSEAGLRNAPSATILPGQTIKWTEGFSLADPEKITFSVSPGSKYKNSVFTNIPQ